MVWMLGIDAQLGTYFPRWSWIPLQFSLAIGPLVFFYVLKITRPEYKLRWKDLLHFGPVLLELGALVLEVKESIKTGAATYDTLTFKELSPILQMLAVASVTIYLRRCYKLIRDFHRRLKVNETDRPQYELRWLRRSLKRFGLFWLLWIPCAAAAYFFHHGQLHIYAYYPLEFVLAVMMIRIAALAFLKPDVAAPPPATQVSKPSPAADLMQKGKWLQKTIEANFFYQDPELTLRSLAEMLDIHPNELSRIINIAFRKNFNDFINEYRIREVTRKMQDPACDRITLLGIAMDAGFNSKSTFNRVFREMTGKSPTEYKTRLKKERPSYTLRPYSHSAAVISYHETTPKWSPEKLNRNHMFRNYLKIAWRNIVHHQSYSAINITGLTVGIAACLLIFVVVQHELSFDTYQPGYKSTYRIVTKKDREGNTRYNGGISAPAVDAFRFYFPQATVAGINAIYGSQIVAPAASSNLADKKFIENTGIMFAEPQLFDIFSATWLAGSPSALKDPNMVVIDKSSAEKYFGDWPSAMGKTLRMDNLLTLKVAGVIRDVPANTDLPFKVLISYITWKQNAKSYGYFNTWDETSSDWQVYIKFPANVSQNTIDRQLLSFSDKQFDNKKRTGAKRYAIAQPLSELHFDTRVGDTLGDHIISRATLRTLSLIAVLIIVMASINFINLSTAQSVGRSKEIGMRKVLGSSRGQLIGLVMCETTIIVLLSAGLAGGVAELALPFLKNIVSIPDTIDRFNPGILLCLAGVIFAVILLSGIYPALIISGFKPIIALKNKINAAAIGGISLRRVLVITQFAISQLLIIGTAIAIKQMDFVNNADLGFNKEAILVVPCPTDSIGLSRLNSFKQQVLTLPGVRAASFTADVPTSVHNNSTNFVFNRSGKDPGFDVFTKIADADYFKTFGLRFIAGKGYQQSDTARELVVNETLIHKLGIKRAEDALGKTISFDSYGQLPIVGVVADFKTNSMREEIKPVVIYPAKPSEQEIAVKIEGQKFAKTLSSVQNIWENRYPEYAYTAFFVDDSIAQFYKQENQLELIYKLFAVIAIFISCLGLYGLVSFMAVQRTREVGIRKVLGASIGSIVYLFSKEFIALIALAFALGAPIAWYLMNGWLQTFAYRISPGVWVFVAAIVTSLLIGCATVGYKAVRAALANPVKSLRIE
jgi:predicted permease